MPWTEKSKVDQRSELVRAVLAGESIAAACRRYGVSRPTGYKWVARYRELGLEGLVDQPRAPKRSPQRVDETVEQLVCQVRRKFPHWGPKKIRAFLQTKRPTRQWPAASTMGDILSRAGLVKPRKRTRSKVPRTAPLQHAQAPNDLWTLDFKGQFRLGDNQYCYPLTVVDAHSRMILGCIALPSVRTPQAKEEVDQLFEKFGLPARIRTDNGAPFASRGLAGLSQLSAHWLSLGIGLERIEPGHPEQNGRHERMHLTLKRETARPGAENMQAQQERFDDFVTYYNEIRPHEALSQTPPGTHYSPSERTLAEAAPDYSDCDLVCRVHANGNLYVAKHGLRLCISAALSGLEVGLTEQDEDLWVVRLGPAAIGMFEAGDTRVEAMPADSLTEFVPEEAA